MTHSNHPHVSDLDYVPAWSRRGKAPMLRIGMLAFCVGYGSAGLALVLSKTADVSPDLAVTRNVMPLPVWGYLMLVAACTAPWILGVRYWRVGLMGCALGAFLTLVLNTTFVYDIVTSGHGSLSCCLAVPYAVMFAGATYSAIKEHEPHQEMVH